MRHFFSAAIAALVLALTGVGADAQDYPRRTMRLAHAFPAAYVQSGVDKWWAEEVEKRSGGRVKVQILWAGAGGKPQEILSLVGSGAVDLGAVPPAYFPNELPLTGAPNALPLTFRKNEHALAIVSEMVEKLPAVRAELKKNGVWPLFFHTLNTYAPLCTKPVATMDDWKGLKIRSFGAYQPIMWEALGAVGVVVLPAEVYEGLQRGRLDCGYYSNDLYVSTKLHEVAKYLSTADFGPNPTWAIWINDELWATKLDPKTKELLANVSQEAAQRSINALADIEEESLRTMKENGVKIVEFREIEKLRATVPDMREVWLKQMDERKLGAEARDLLAFWRKREVELK